MKMNAGLWIDHRKAVIMILTPRGEETMEIRSNVEKHPGRAAGARSTEPYEAQLVQADTSRERKLTGQLDQYYTEVTAALRGVEALLIFGPGEAKVELKNHLDQANLGEKFMAMETSDKMTGKQIAAKIRDYFH